MSASGFPFLRQHLTYCALFRFIEHGFCAHEGTTLHKCVICPLAVSFINRSDGLVPHTLRHDLLRLYCLNPIRFRFICRWIASNPDAYMLDPYSPGVEEDDGDLYLVPTAAMLANDT